MPEKLKLAYTISGLARELGLDRRKLARMLKNAKISLRKSKIWISEIRLHLPELLDSWDEIEHRRRMALGPPDEDDEDNTYE